jgi:ribonuclease HII
MKNWEFRSNRIVVGVDEVGVGSLAGPITACAVILNSHKIELLNDSKKLSRKNIVTASKEIAKNASLWNVGWGLLEDIEKDGPNIRFSVMAYCVESLISRLRPEEAENVLVVVDGNQELSIKHQQIALVNADSRCAEVAAASILAKYIRDLHMETLHFLYPEYGWNENKGYGTQQHKEALAKYGATPLHRRKFTDTAMANFARKANSRK